MRIIAGEFKGRVLVAPKSNTTRPTADRTREALFNILTHAAWRPSLSGARVIDLFAGSGALGFEALSRGASFALFVETEASARGAIRANAEALGLLGVTRIHRRSAVDLGQKPAGLGEPFDLAFLDPPYGAGLVRPCLDILKSGTWLKPTALIVVETAQKEDLDISGLQLLDERVSGAARLWFLQFSTA